MIFIKNIIDFLFFLVYNFITLLNWEFFYMKVNLYLNDELVARLDKFAKSNYYSRSSVIVMACNEFLQKQAAFSVLTDIKVLLNKIAADGSLDKTSLKKLDDFEKILSLLN